MREIKFRGKRKDIDWKYGYLTCIENRALTGWEQKPAIRPFDELFITYGVDPDTIGEYTGLKDKNGKEIYEGDITNYGVVEWNDHLNWDGGGSNHPGFYFKDGYEYKEDGGLSYHTGFDIDIVVRGNIYENPELFRS